MYARLTVVKATDPTIPGDSDLGEETKILFGNVRAKTPKARAAFEASFTGEDAARRWGWLLFPDEVVAVQWKKKEWTVQEIIEA